MKLKNLLVFVLVIPVAFLLSACSHDVGSSGGGSSSSSGDNSNADFTIEATSDFKFTPNLIEAEAGETITVEVTGTGHDLVIDELDVDTGLIFGSKTVSITIPEDAKLGDEYEFYCSISNHRAMGMVGTLRVK